METNPDNLTWLLGLYDELSSFLIQINLYGSKRISDSHDTQPDLHTFVTTMYCVHFEQITYDSSRLCAVPQCDGGYFQRESMYKLLFYTYQAWKVFFYPLGLKYEVEELKERVLFLEAELKWQEQR